MSCTICFYRCYSQNKNESQAAFLQNGVTPNLAKNWSYGLLHGYMHHLSNTELGTVWGKIPAGPIEKQSKCFTSFCVTLLWSQEQLRENPTFFFPFEKRNSWGCTDYVKNLKAKNNLIQLYLYTHAEIKFLHFLVKEGRHGAKKTNKQKKSTWQNNRQKNSNYSHFLP